MNKKKSVLAIGFRQLFILEFHLIQETYMLLKGRGEIKEEVWRMQKLIFSILVLLISALASTWHFNNQQVTQSE